MGFGAVCPFLARRNPCKLPIIAYGNHLQSATYLGWIAVQILVKVSLPRLLLGPRSEVDTPHCRRCRAAFPKLARGLSTVGPRCLDDADARRGKCRPAAAVRASDAVA